MKRILVFAFTLTVIAAKCYSQVNFQTGSAVFSLPMFNWQDHKSRLTSIVALSYNSGNGLRVNDFASNIGQGWNLLAGGVITRMQIGEPDDQYRYFVNQNDIKDVKRYPNGILYASKDAEDGCPVALTRYPLFRSMNEEYAERNEVAEDKQLDYFSFQFNGKAGMFVLDPDSIGKAHMLGDSRIKITFQLDAGLIAQGIRTRITSFSIHDVDGLIYKFAKHGLTKILESAYCDETLTYLNRQPEFKSNRTYFMNGFDNGKYHNPYIINSWYLTEVEDALTHRKILFNYTNRTINATAGADLSTIQPKNYSIIAHKRSVTVSPDLTTITYPDGHTVTFNYGAARLDYSGGYILSSVDFTYQSRPLSKYIFNSTYFVLNRYGTPITDYQKKMARLCLRSVQKIGVDLKDDSPPYLFDYYLGSNASDDFVPGPFFFAKDIWGYFNGSNSTAFSNAAISLTKDINKLTNDEVKGLCYLRDGISGVHLNAKPGYAKNGLLKQIIYPTGGTLSYEYEQNTGVLGGSTKNVGGVHVSKTSSTDGGYSNACENPIITNYNYVLSGSSQSSLWGLEMPVNKMENTSYYEPESKYYSWLGFKCKYRFQYPGILSQQQAIDLSGFQKFMIAAEPILNILSFASTVMNVANLIAATVPGFGTIAAVVIDVIVALVSIFTTCFGNKSRTFASTVYYNSDLNSIAPLPTQFKRVEIVEGSGTMGKTIQEFTNDADYAIWESSNPFFSAKQRFAPWAYGLPKKVIVLDANGNKRKETENQYLFHDAKKPYCWGGAETRGEGEMSEPPRCLISTKCLVQNARSLRHTDWFNVAMYNDPASYIITSSPDLKVDMYNMYSGVVRLYNTYERVFDVATPSAYIQTTTNYQYSVYNDEVNKVTVFKHNGDVEAQEIVYTADIFGGIYTTLKNANVLGLVDRTTTTITKNGTPLPLDVFESRTDYIQLSNGDIKPKDVYERRANQPYNRYPYPPQLPLVSSFSYDNTGNLVGITEEGGRKVVNLFGYDDKYIIGTVINAGNADKVAYSSFEVTGLVNTGNWVISGTQSYNSPGVAVTGSRTFALLTSAANYLTASGLNTSKPYTLTFWSNNANVVVSAGSSLVKSGPTINGFTYYEYAIAQGTASVNLRTLNASVNSNIDELRLYPQTARMSTVTYDPLIGKTSACDENNRLQYYEYDNAGRLLFIKDENRNVIKMYEYNNISVAKQNGCPGTYSNKLISEEFVRSNCGFGYVGGAVVYTIPANTFTSTISQQDADMKAETYLLTNGQSYANANGSCVPIYYNTAQSQNFQTENCPPGYVGGTVAYSVPANRYSSLVSVADANDKALEEIAANGQAHANGAGAVCNTSTAALWEWKEGDPSYCFSIGGNLPPHLFILETDVNPNSATYNQTRWSDIGPSDDCPANTYFNDTKSGSFTRNNCGSGYTGSSVTYTVPRGTYGSTVSQAAADALAQNDVNTNGQAYANANGACIPTSCSFSSVPNASIVSSMISRSGNTVSFYLTVSNVSSTNWSGATQIAQIASTYCRPEVGWSTTFSDGTRSWILIIEPSGAVKVVHTGGSAPYNGISIPISYRSFPVQ